MTNEEAVKIIKSECYIANLLNLDRTRMVNTALDLAIKALEQQPCDDCISREAVRKILGNEVFRLMKLHTVNPEDNPKADTMAYGVNWSLNTLMELPSVTPNYNSIKSELDYISRADALKVIEKEKQGWEGAERYAIDECHTRIAELPSVTPKTEWIPVSENGDKDNGKF